MRRSSSTLVMAMLSLACSPSDAAPTGGAGEGEASSGSSSSASGDPAPSSTAATEDETGEPPQPLDCSHVPEALTSARWWTSAESQDFGLPVPFAATTAGRAVWLVEERLTWIAADGELATPMAMAPGEHPTGLVGTPRGSVIVAGWRDAGVSGENDAFLVELDADGTRGDETSWNVEPDANEKPIAIVTSPAGAIAVVTDVAFDATMPTAEPFVRLDRFDAALVLGHSLVLGAPLADLAIDDDGTAYLATSGASVGIAAIDSGGATRWEAFEPYAGAWLGLAVGDAHVWLAQRSGEGFGGGSLRALDRKGGAHDFTEMFTADDLSMPIENPVDVAASPCGGAWLVAEGRYDGDSYVTLSYFDDGGTRSDVTNAPQPPPVSGASYGDIYGIDRGADGSVVVVGRLSHPSSSRVWASAF